MSPPFADQPAALPQAPSVLSQAAPFGDPGLTVTLLYRTSTARVSLHATLAVKVLLAVTLGTYVDFALPPYLEPNELHQARPKPVGFLRDPFQVFCNCNVIVL